METITAIEIRAEYAKWSEAKRKRNLAVRENASRRMRNPPMPPLELPPKPGPQPMRPYLETADGDYQGCIWPDQIEDYLSENPDWVVKWMPYNGCS